MSVVKARYRPLYSRERSPVRIATKAVWSGLDILERRKYPAMREI
jgi:hypothetical protein